MDPIGPAQISEEFLGATAAEGKVWPYGFEAAIACANGLEFERALGAITIDAARILGVDQRVGSLEVGKDGDIALYDGDPFEYTSHCIGVVIDGVAVSELAR